MHNIIYNVIPIVVRFNKHASHTQTQVLEDSLSRSLSLFSMMCDLCDLWFMICDFSIYICILFVRIYVFALMAWGTPWSLKNPIWKIIFSRSFAPTLLRFPPIASECVCLCIHTHKPLLVWPINHTRKHYSITSKICTKKNGLLLLHIHTPKSHAHPRNRCPFTAFSSILSLFPAMHEQCAQFHKSNQSCDKQHILYNKPTPTMNTIPFPL